MTALSRRMSDAISNHADLNHPDVSQMFHEAKSIVFQAENAFKALDQATGYNDVMSVREHAMAILQGKGSPFDHLQELAKERALNDQRESLSRIDEKLRDECKVPGHDHGVSDAEHPRWSEEAVDMARSVLSAADAAVQHAVDEGMSAEEKDQVEREAMTAKVKEYLPGPGESGFDERAKREELRARGLMPQRREPNVSIRARLDSLNDMIAVFRLELSMPALYITLPREIYENQLRGHGVITLEVQVHD